MEEQKLNFATIKSAIEKLDAERTVYPGIKLVKSDALTGTQVLIKSGEKVYYSPDIKSGEVKVINVPEPKIPTFMDELSQWDSEPILVNKKIQAYFTPAVEIGYDPLRYKDENKPCKPEHKVDGVIPMLYDIHLDKKNCDCGRVRFEAEECGCSIKEYRLIKIPNE